MADLRPPRSRSRSRSRSTSGSGSGPLPASGSDRGQLIVVTALVIAVAMVALVLFVNTAIYTENLATRGADVGESEALDYRATLASGAAGVIERENFAEYGDRANVEENVTAGIATVDRELGRTLLVDGAGASINDSATDYGDGILIRQTDPSRNMTPNSQLAVNWTVAEDVGGTRNASMTVDAASLAQADESTAESDAFHVVAADSASAAEWHLYLYEDQATGATTLAVKNGSESGATAVCTASGSTVHVGLTNASFGGDPCPALSWAKGVSGDYDVEYRNPGEAEGTYDLTVAGDEGSLGLGVLGNLNEGPGASSPYYVPAVYDAELRFRYESSDLSYEATIRVAPGEPS